AEIRIKASVGVVVLVVLESDRDGCSLSEVLAQGHDAWSYCDVHDGRDGSIEGHHVVEVGSRLGKPQRRRSTVDVVGGVLAGPLSVEALERSAATFGCGQGSIHCEPAAQSFICVPRC